MREKLQTSYPQIAAMIAPLLPALWITRQLKILMKATFKECTAERYVHCLRAVARPWMIGVKVSTTRQELIEVVETSGVRDNMIRAVRNNHTGNRLPVSIENVAPNVKSALRRSRRHCKNRRDAEILDIFKDERRQPMARRTCHDPAEDEE